MRKYLFVLFSLMLLIGCQSAEEEADDASNAGDSAESTADDSETSTEDSMEDTTTEEDSSSESADSSENASEQDDSEEINVAAERCIISNLGDCDGVPLEEQKAAFQRLVDEGVFGKMEMSDTFLEEVLGAHVVMHNQIEHNTYPEDRYPPSSVDDTIKYYSMELENYYNGEDEAVLDYLKEDSPLYQSIVENKESGDFADYKLYDIEMMPAEGSGGPSSRVVERIYSHASSNGIERERVSYDTSDNDTGANGKIQLGDIESREVLEENIEYEEEVNEVYGPANTASPHARECVINFIRTCELDSIEDVRDAYDQYVANDTLPEATEAKSYPAKIDESREKINYQVRAAGSMVSKNYENYLKHYVYDLLQFYNEESGDALYYVRPESEAYDAILANKESGDYADQENHLVNVDDDRFNDMDEGTQEMVVERVYSDGSADGKRNSSVLYQFDLDDVSGIQIKSFEELSDEPLEE
ncbi:hypothetical protein ACFOU0_04545 [Salinicoccus sesuvii]|uniref:Lipoprotein n=1 Tax=Salinicoccus sesuvii TaxID=868281 RepID=A0ABV7N5V9_9STAP